MGCGGNGSLKSLIRSELDELNGRVRVSGLKMVSGGWSEWASGSPLLRASRDTEQSKRRSDSHLLFVISFGLSFDSATPVLIRARLSGYRWV
ncbi:hypothetical protein NL676_015917 [Syzygium grande]|nr:hypothetical protein NL676_015917 [Syzygium grande]